LKMGPYMALNLNVCNLACQVARITGMSHQCLNKISLLCEI
jgi:hypothetical protein